MKTRRLGNSTLIVSELGFGCMGLNSVYGEADDPAAMIDLVRRSVDLGITLFDTAQLYGPRSNEELVGKSLEPVRDRVVIATKFGYDLDPAGGPVPADLNSRPEQIKTMAEESLRRLRTDSASLNRRVRTLSFGFRKPLHDDLEGSAWLHGRSSRLDRLSCRLSNHQHQDPQSSPPVMSAP